MRETIPDQARTGHIIGSLVAHCVTVSFFMSFFCISKVMETQSDSLRLGDVLGMTVPFRANCILQILNCFVRPGRDTFKYSHDRQAKKKAPIINCAVACVVSVV